MTRTMQELAREALLVQDACNLSGVVHEFSKVVTELRELLPEAGTEEINRHPVCILFVDKLHVMTIGEGKLNGADSYIRAYQWAKEQSVKTVV